MYMYQKLPLYLVSILNSTTPHSYTQFIGSVPVSKGKSNQDPISLFSAMQRPAPHMYVYIIILCVPLIYSKHLLLGMWLATLGRAVVLGMPSACTAELANGFLIETP